MAWLDTFSFQSPRSGKFVSDQDDYIVSAYAYYSFQSPRSGKFVSDQKYSIWSSS